MVLTPPSPEIVGVVLLILINFFFFILLNLLNLLNLLFLLFLLFSLIYSSNYFSDSHVVIFFEGGRTPSVDPPFTKRQPDKQQSYITTNTRITIAKQAEQNEL